MQKGFTFIEFLIVIATLSIIALMLLPSFNFYYAQNRVKSVAENLYDDINLARTAAIEQSTNVTLVVTTGTNWCYGMTTNASCTCSSAGSCNLGQTTNASYPNTSLSSFATSVVFDSVRGTPASSGAITVSNTSGSEQITLTLSPFGTATLCSSGTVGGYGC